MATFTSGQFSVTPGGSSKIGSLPSSLQNLTPGGMSMAPRPVPFVQPQNTVSQPKPVSSPVNQDPVVSSPVNDYANTPRYDTTTGQPTAYGSSLGLQPRNFSVTPSADGTVSSSALNNKTSMDSLNSMYQKQVNGLVGGSGNKIPSDNLYGQIAGQIYGASQYTDEEKNALQNIASAQSAAYTTELAQRRQIEQLQSNGDITQEQAKAMIADTTVRTQRTIAEANANISFGQNQLGVLGQIRGNSLTALQNYMTALQPTQVAPGSTLYNPVTGVNYQGAGASPTQIASLAQQLADSDRNYGSMVSNPDGSPNYQAYYQRAQAMISGQNPASVGGGMTSGGQTGSGMPRAGTLEGDQYYSSLEFAQQLPPAVYPSKKTTSTGKTFFDAGALDQTGLGEARRISKVTGIPILDAVDAKAVGTTDQAIKNLQLLQANFETIAKGDIGSTFGAYATDPFSQLFQTDRGRALTTYNNNRDGLLQQIRALAGSSPRINSQELNLANSALPMMAYNNKDTLQQGVTKIDTVMGYLNNAMTTLIKPDGVSGAASAGTLGNTNQSSGGGGLYDF